MEKCGRLAVIATIVVIASSASGMAEELIGRALASGAHLLAVSDRSVSVSSEVTTQLAHTGTDGSNLPEVPAERYTRAIAFAPCAENATLDWGTLTVPSALLRPVLRREFYGAMYGVAVG